jgi:hypothetical protein
MKITNINGTYQLNCSCGSWIAHWKKFSGHSITYCPVSSCLNTNLVGAHVRKANSTDQKWYICPLCATHNAATGDLEVGAVTLVSASMSETCG